jgi:ribosomal protein L37AE/L43A
MMLAKGHEMSREVESEDEKPEDEKPEECNFCGYPTVELVFYKYNHAEIENAWLCEVCASTLAGNAYHFPRQYENQHIMKQVSFCTNLILDKLKAA